MNQLVPGSVIFLIMRTAGGRCPLYRPEPGEASCRISKPDTNCVRFVTAAVHASRKPYEVPVLNAITDPIFAEKFSVKRISLLSSFNISSVKAALLENFPFFRRGASSIQLKNRRYLRPPKCGMLRRLQRLTSHPPAPGCLHTNLHPLLSGQSQVSCKGPASLFGPILRELLLRGR